MQTHLPGESAEHRAARDRLSRITPAIVLIGGRPASLGVCC
jgi:hypothetical protein